MNREYIMVRILKRLRRISKLKHVHYFSGNKVRAIQFDRNNRIVSKTYVKTFGGTVEYFSEYAEMFHPGTILRLYFPLVEN